MALAIAFIFVQQVHSLIWKLVIALVLAALAVAEVCVEISDHRASPEEPLTVPSAESIEEAVAEVERYRAHPGRGSGPSVALHRAVTFLQWCGVCVGRGADRLGALFETWRDSRR